MKMHSLIMIVGVVFLVGCLTNGPMGLMDIREGGRLYDSGRMIAYMRDHVSLDIDVGSIGDVRVTNHGEQTVAIDPGRMLWILHCDDKTWIPLPRESGSLPGPVFVTPNETVRMVSGPRLDGYVLSPGHMLQVVYVGADGVIIKASGKVPCHDQALRKARALSEQQKKDEVLPVLIVPEASEPALFNSRL
jgi:hypothetical protein